MKQARDLAIANNTSVHRFETWIDGQLALLNYRVEGDTIFLQYVEVPPEARGQGIAGRLASAALRYARENNWRAVAHCPYIANYMFEHPGEVEPRR
jgi:predicted GNAT family acetyltransferase